MTRMKKTQGQVFVVRITPEIIKRSTRANSKTCMIAEAIKVSFPEAKAVSVDIQMCRLTDTKKGLRYIYLTPRAAQKSLIDFDQGINPVPFVMVLKNAHFVRRARGRKPETGFSENRISGDRSLKTSRAFARRRTIGQRGDS